MSWPLPATPKACPPRTRTLPTAIVAVLVALGGVVFLAGCPRSNPSGLPPGADPEKLSRAEYDVAQDEWHRGRLRSAMDHAQKASNFDESYAEAHRFVAILFLALCQSEGDCRFADAEKYARKAVAVDGESRDAKHTLGLLLLQQKKYDDAIAVLKPLSEDLTYKTPELAWYDLGGAYLEKGEPDRAVDALLKAIALKPTFCWANYRLGLAYEKKGDLTKAEVELTKAVEPEIPACKKLQHAYQVRARVRAKLGRNELARQDYETCAKLAIASPEGKSCAAALKGAL